jgi:hypothetical protein
MAITFESLAPPVNHILVTRHDRVPVPKVIDLESPSRPDERVFPLQFLRRDLARWQTARVLCALVVLTIPFALTLMTITQARPLVVDLGTELTPSLIRPIHSLHCPASSEAHTTSPSLRANTWRFAKAGGA